MSAKEKAYPFDRIEPRWQNYWVKNKTFKAWDPGQIGSEKPKYYVLDMFPYPSAAGLHVGHLEGYTATDIISRYKRMKGFNVLHPMGWDAFGLPAEQYAIETKTHPKIVTKQNVDNFRRQIQSIGFSYDWDREVDTTDPNYYRWTQWIFLKLFEKGLAYEAEIPVNWCPALGTVLANEEVIDGKSERGGHPVIQKPMRQWVLKITAYADRLLEDLEELDWPESIKEMQRNWIGRSIGAEVDFQIAGSNEKIRVFTTRPDTLFGATYMVLSPEHPLVSKVTTADQKSAVSRYQEESSRKSDLQRTDLAKEKSGVFTGAYAVNPVNGQKIPIWIADYVLVGYGTGAIMAVPAHDERDYEFAHRYKLPIIEVISGGNIKEAAFTGVGNVVNSKTPDGSFTINGLRSDEAINKITSWIEQKKLGKKAINYRLRDWLFSRQRYWGEPIPVVHVDGKPKVIPESQLPLILPEVKSYEPTGTGESPLASIKDWVETQDPLTGKPAKRETNTMPQWAGSCWYYLRYLDTKNKEALVDKVKEKYWMPVDIYIGGVEHAVLHLLYARFWHKVLFDLGIVSTKEPFQKLMNQGLILGPDGQKMSKSRGNVINPDDLISRFGADSLRLYEMFMGPLEDAKPWQPDGIIGLYRFLSRVYNLAEEVKKAQKKKAGKSGENSTDPRESASKDSESSSIGVTKLLHKTIKKVTADIEQFRFNTAISAMMILLNEIEKQKSQLSVINCQLLIKLLFPFAPHLCQELWQQLGNDTLLDNESWPAYDENLIVDDEVELLVQVNGKLRDKIKVSPAITQEDAEKSAMASPKVQEFVGKKKPVKIIFVPGRLINIVV